MLSLEPVPEHISLVVINNDDRQGLRIQLGKLDDGECTRHTSILDCSTHLGDFVYDGYSIVIGDNVINCNKSYSCKYSSAVIFIPNDDNKCNCYFLYTTKQLKLSYKLVNRLHDYPTCFYKRESEEIVQSIDLPQLPRPVNNNIGKLTMKVDNLELNFYCYDEAFSLTITYSK